jgi:hypothetical protein
MLIGKAKGKRLLGNDNIKMDLKEIGCEVVKWINVAQSLTLVNTVTNVKGSVKGG